MSGNAAKPVVIDTDTAGDDSQAILMSVLSDRVIVEGLTIVAGNVEFDREVENAKYTLDLVDAADDVPVYEGCRSPLLKDYEHADYVHGEGGLGGDLFPDTGIPSADSHAVDYLVETAHEHDGDLSLLCIGPLTNVALACKREPELNGLLDEVWVMGGAVNCPGNVTPAAEFNFWVDPDAAKLVLSELDVHLVDWGLCLDASLVLGEDFEAIRGYDTELADFFLELGEPVLEFTREEQGFDGATSPDSLAAACMIAPEVRRRTAIYPADVDEREGLTRGHSAVDTVGGEGNPDEPEQGRTTVVEAADHELFREMTHGMLDARDPDRPL